MVALAAGQWDYCDYYDDYYDDCITKGGKPKPGQQPNKNKNKVPAAAAINHPASDQVEFIAPADDDDDAESSSSAEFERNKRMISDATSHHLPRPQFY